MERNKYLYTTCVFLYKVKEITTTTTTKTKNKQKQTNKKPNNSSYRMSI